MIVRYPTCIQYSPGIMSNPFSTEAVLRVEHDVVSGGCTLGTTWSLFLVAVMKQSDKGNLREEGLVCLIVQLTVRHGGEATATGA